VSAGMKRVGSKIQNSFPEFSHNQVVKVWMCSRGLEEHLSLWV